MKQQYSTLATSRRIEEYMEIGTALVGAAGKTVFTWLGSVLSDWIKGRKATAAEEKEWAAVAAIVLKQTKVIAERYKKITTVAFPRESVYLNSIYVPLTIEATDQSVSARIDNFPTELLIDEPKLLVVDVAGMGKSTISKILFLRALEEKLFLPILIDLRRLDGSQEIDVALARQFGIRLKHVEIFTEFLTSQPLLFLFDGFDEIADPKKVDVARTIRRFVDRAESAKFVITSRPDLQFSDYTDFKTVRIRELTKEEADSLIRKYGAAFGIEDRAKALLEELKARHDGPVSSFLKNPLLASLLFRAFEYKSVIPVKRGVFYRQVFDALYEAHDLSKETGYVREKKTGLHQDDFHRALRAMAKLFRQKRVVEVDVETFQSMAKEISRSLCPDLNFAPESFLSDVIHAVPLFQRDGNFVRWAHKSLLDYFLSEFLLRDYSESKEEALRASAFGQNSRINENFLVLIHEADPILFARAVTLPAIRILLDRHRSIISNMPAKIDRETAADAALFFMVYEIFFIGHEDSATRNWRNILSRLDPTSGSSLHLAEFVPQLIYHFDENTPELGVYMHEAAMALLVPIALGVIPYMPAYEVMRKYPRATIEDGGLSRFGGTATFFSSRKTKEDWQLLEDEFAALMGLLHHSDLKLLSPVALEKIERELDKLVSVSLRARSNEIF